MLITDRIKGIKWYDFNKPLDSEKMKHYDEYFALAVLRYCYPERYADYIIADAPDLQSRDGKSGIEVTLATNETIASIEGNFAKYRLSDEASERNKLRNKITDKGASLDSFGLAYPEENGLQDEAKIRCVIRKKNAKLSSYLTKGFQRIELFIRFSGMPAIIKKETYIKMLSEASGYETVFFTAPSCLMVYRPADYSFTVVKIPDDDYSALGAIARLTVDGKIGFNSPTWTE